MAFNSAAQRMTEKEFDELEQQLEQLSTTISKDAYFETAYADLEFHRFIWKQSGNIVLHDTLDQLVMPLMAYVSILRKSGRQELKNTVRSHENLIAALKSRDARVIKETLRQHLENYENDV
jgi:DNA-binding GntR family transcriptional regulator